MNVLIAYALIAQKEHFHKESKPIILIYYQSLNASGYDWMLNKTQSKNVIDEKIDFKNQIHLEKSFMNF